MEMREREERRRNIIMRRLEVREERRKEMPERLLEGIRARFKVEKIRKIGKDRKKEGEMV